jgi:hypothetical protein
MFGSGTTPCWMLIVRLTENEEEKEIHGAGISSWGL